MLNMTTRTTRYLTVRDVPGDVARALEHERRRSGRSLNRTVIDLLARALGLEGGAKSNGLERLAGAWSKEDLAEFEAATKCFGEIDEAIWR